MDSINYYGELLLANQVREEGLDWGPEKYGIKSGHVAVLSNL
jgi:hypothetical protein